MKRILALLAIACCATLLPGCASGPKFSEVKSSFPPLAEENGRIYFYRTTVFGAGVQPAVKLNSQKIGTAKPQGFYLLKRKNWRRAAELSCW